jgi:putative FmdB family regulatory protein
MPIYEFYCEDCHTVFNFFSRRVNVDKRPACPKCGRPEIERRVSLFAISKGRKTEDDDMPDMDEDRMMKAMEALAGDMDGVDEEDPRQAAQMMRKLFDATGLKLGAGMEEAIRRMEAGEDPDRIEEELGDVLEEEDPFGAMQGKTTIKDLKRRFLPPKVDETLYEL